MENLVLITFISAGVSALISYAAIRLHLEILEIKISNLLEEQDKDFKNQLDEVNKIVYEVLKNKKWLQANFTEFYTKGTYFY